MAIEAGTAAVGATQFFMSPEGPGAAYVFVEPNGGWVNTTETARLMAAKTSAGSAFGAAVAIQGNAIVVGSPWQNDYQGAVYTFNKPTTGWRTTENFNSKLSPAGLNAFSGFGTAVALGAKTLVLGEPGLSTSRNVPGRAHIFEQK